MTFRTENDDENNKIPLTFVDMGYSSMFTIVNLGSTFVYMVVYLGLCVVYLLIALPFNFLSRK